MLLIVFYIFPVKVILKLSNYGLLIIVLKASVNMHDHVFYLFVFFGLML